MIANLNQLERKSSLSLRKINEQYYLIDAGNCYQVNLTGAMIVNSIGNDLTIDMLCEKLSKKCSYPDLDAISADVEAFIKFLVEEKLVIIK